MTLKTPFKFEINPDKISKGSNWVTVSLKNMSTDDMTKLDVKLHSEDPYLVDIMGKGAYILELKAMEERVLPFQVNAEVSTELFATVSGYRDGEYFFWTSPKLEIEAGFTEARLRNVFALMHPHALAKRTIEVDAVIESVTGGEDFRLVFWHDSPSSYDKIGETEITRLEPREEVTKSTEFTPEECGIHEIHVYLYHDNKYFGSGMDTIRIE